jgi:hypothetical protein
LQNHGCGQFLAEPGQDSRRGDMHGAWAMPGSGDCRRSVSDHICPEPIVYELNPGGKEADRTLPQANGPLIFKDDFDGPQPVAEPLFPDPATTLVREHGQGRLTGIGPDIWPVVYTEYHQLQDFYADFVMRIPEDKMAGGCGVLFRQMHGPGWLSYYALTFFPSTGTVEVKRFESTIVPNKWTVLKKPDYHIALNQDVVVRLEVVGQQFRVFVDHKFLFEVTDAALPGPGFSA